jgi:hypothetical protein
MKKQTIFGAASLFTLAFANGFRSGTGDSTWGGFLEY